MTIQISNLSFTYPGRKQPALKGISLEVRKGEFLGVTGPTGAGKSTLLKCANGIIPHFQEGRVDGEVLVNGLPVSGSTLAELARVVGSVFEDPEEQMVSSLVEEELAFGMENMGLSRAEMEERITSCLQMVGIESLRYRKIEALSGGQKQLVVLAAVMAMRPPVLLLDEPTSALDPLGTERFLSVLTRLNREYGITIVLVEQKMTPVVPHLDRLVVLDRGELVVAGPPRQVLADMKLMDKVGVEIPELALLYGLLQERGFSLGDLPLTVPEAEFQLTRLLGGDIKKCQPGDVGAGRRN